MERLESFRLNLETERFFLRPFHESDAPALFRLNNDKEVMRYTGDVPFETLGTAKNFVRAYNDDPNGQYRKYGLGRLAAIRKSDLKCIGWCGLKYHNDKDVVDLGYRLLREEWGKGYATELAKASLIHAFHDHQLNEVIATIHEKNIGSQKVALRAGMTLQYRFLWDGKLPAQWYSIHKQ